MPAGSEALKQGSRREQKTESYAKKRSRVGVCGIDILVDNLVDFSGGVTQTSTCIGTIEGSLDDDLAVAGDLASVIHELVYNTPICKGDPHPDSLGNDQAWPSAAEQGDLAGRPALWSAGV